jgi:hypothetical protein
VWVQDANAETYPGFAVKLTNNLDFILARQLPPPVSTLVDFNLPGTGGKSIVVDSHDNAWAANWLANSVSAFNSQGLELPGSPFQVLGPWGLSLDGRDNLWVAGFGAAGSDAGHSISNMCGAASSECTPGQLLSPLLGCMLFFLCVGFLNRSW